MQTSSTRLKKPLHVWLARTIAIAVILLCIWLNITALPAAMSDITGGGLILDIGWKVDESGQMAVINFVTIDASTLGVNVGDKLLNPWDASMIGDIGSPVTLHLQDQAGLIRYVTFSRKPFGG